MERRIVFVAMPPVLMLDVVGPVEVFTHCAGYRVEVLTGGESGWVMGSSGLKLGEAKHFSKLRGKVDTLLVAGGPGARLIKSPALSQWLRKMAGRVRRIGSICTGAFLLAEAGLLDGRRVVTHWNWCSSLAKKYPMIRVEGDPIYIKDGPIYTSAGITAGIDLALALVEEDHGYQKAMEIARELVMFVRRPGGQSQYSALLEAQAGTRKPLEELRAWMSANLESKLDVDSLASRCNMSPRHFARVFRAELGMTPARFVERMRVESARCLVVDEGQGLKEVADRCGFGGTDVMRRSFMRVLGVSAHEYGERFQRGNGGHKMRA